MEPSPKGRRLLVRWLIVSWLGINTGVPFALTLPCDPLSTLDYLIRVVTDFPVERTVLNPLTGQWIQHRFDNARYLAISPNASSSTPPEIAGAGPGAVVDIGWGLQAMRSTAEHDRYLQNPHSNVDSRQALNAHVSRNNFQTGTLDIFTPDRIGKADVDVDAGQIYGAVTFYGTGVSLSQPVERHARGPRRNPNLRLPIRIFLVRRSNANPINEPVPVEYLQVASDLAGEMQVPVLINNHTIQFQADGTVAAPSSPQFSNQWIIFSP